MAQSSSSSSIRLNKYLADCGLTSRRKADEWIEAGKVKLNGKIVYELGVKVDPKKDEIVVNGKKLKTRPDNNVYIIFNKPTHVMTTLSDPEGRMTVKDFFPKLKTRIYPVGRLDWDTEGLLLMTNDGDFAQAVSHPSQAIPKTYLCKLDGQPTEAQLDKLRNGISIVGGRVKAMYVERMKKGSEKYDWVRISVGEGKNRQVRKMFEKIGFDVKKLKRVAIGALPLGTLPKGGHAYITDAGLAKIFELPKWMQEPTKRNAEKKRTPRKKKVGKKKTGKKRI